MQQDRTDEAAAEAGKDTHPAVSGREDGRLRSDTRRPRHTRSLHVHSTTGGVDNFVKELGT